MLTGASYCISRSRTTLTNKNQKLTVEKIAQKSDDDSVKTKNLTRYILFNMTVRFIVVLTTLFVMNFFNTLVDVQGDASSDKSTKCECAAFNGENENIPEGMEPLLAQNPMNVTCNEEGAKNCELLCIELVKVGKEKAPEILCDHLKHFSKLKPSLWTRTCDGAWKSTGLTCEREICCHDGKPISCVEL